MLIYCEKDENALKVEMANNNKNFFERLAHQICDVSSNVSCLEWFYFLFYSLWEDIFYVHMCKIHPPTLLHGMGSEEFI